MLRVLHLINSYNHKVNTYIFDPDNNELIDPKTGESWFFTMDAWTKILGNNHLFIIIKRTF